MTGARRANRDLSTRVSPGGEIAEASLAHNDVPSRGFLLKNSEVPVGDQFDALAFEGVAGGVGGEDFQFGGAGFAQAGFDSA